MHQIKIFLFMLVMLSTQGCQEGVTNKTGDNGLLHLMVLAPGHFHAALLQKSMYPEIDTTVYVFAPEGPELQSYLALIDQYNHRKDQPTGWRERVYTGPDYLEKMIREKPGNLVVIAGNNRMKTDYIKRSVDAGVNVLADKPMAITEAGFKELEETFREAEKKKVFIYDIMTERYEITNMLQKALAHVPGVFGQLQEGTLADPSVIFSSTHYFFKEVSGKPLLRPDWYFDVDQQGDGIVDITTHLVDLIQWECFPDSVLEGEKDVRMLSARHWPTLLTLAQFQQVTGDDAFPGFLKKDSKDSILSVYANGEMNYTLKGIHVRVGAVWNFEAPPGTGDTFFTQLRGTRATLVIRQGAEQGYLPVLYIQPEKPVRDAGWEQSLKACMDSLGRIYPGISLRKDPQGWRVDIPDTYKIGHEQQFALVIKQYLDYLREDSMPAWEIAGMSTKYYTTIAAWKMATARQ